MSIIILICLFLSSLIGVSPQTSSQVKNFETVQERPAESELIGFEPETVTRIKTLFGKFFTEVEAPGGFYFPGIHDKAEVMGEMLTNDRRSFESFNPRIECR